MRIGMFQPVWVPCSAALSVIAPSGPAAVHTLLTAEMGHRRHHVVHGIHAAVPTGPAARQKRRLPRFAGASRRWVQQASREAVASTLDQHCRQPLLPPCGAMYSTKCFRKECLYETLSEHVAIGQQCACKVSFANFPIWKELRCPRF